MGWIKIEPKDAIVGDAVRFTLWCTRRTPDGRPRYRKVEGERDRLLQAPVKMAGRVVDHGPDDDGVDGLWIERTNAGAFDDDVDVPDILHVIARSRLKDLERLDEEGSPRRNDHAGRQHLLASLVRAAGGDGESSEAVARVAACVTGSSISAGVYHGRLPNRVGEEWARRMLSGETMVSEYVIRQLDGRMPIPEARDRTET